MDHLGGPIGGLPEGIPEHEGVKELAKEAVALPAAVGPQQPAPNTPLPLARHLNEGNVEMINLAKQEAPHEAKEGEAKPISPQFAGMADTCILATLNGDNSMNMVEGLCKKGLSLDTPDPATGLNAIAFAAMHAKKEEGGACIKELIKLGASVNAQDADGKTALMHVLKNPHIDAKTQEAAISQLLDNQITLDAKDANGISALGHAIRAGDEKLEVARLLIKELTSRKVDILPLLKGLGLSDADASNWKNMINTMDKGWLNKAPQEQWDKLPKILTENKDQVISPRRPEPQVSPRQYPDLCNMPNSRGESALHLIAKYTDDTRTMRFLLNKGADPNIQEKRGDTPLHIAAQLEKPTMATALLNANANINLPNKLGHTAYDEALIHGSFTVTKPLLEAGAIDRDLCDIRDSFTQNISLSPPIPEDGIHNPESEGIKNRFNAFVAKHDDLEMRTALNVMMEKTDYVSFSDFEKQFDAIIADLNKSIPKNEEYIILIEPDKSNKWLAELGFAKLQTFPKDILRMSDLHHELQQPYNKGVKRVVLLDDASYSGEQMCRFIRENAVTAFTDAQRADFTINVAIPYVTRWARDKIIAINNDPALPQTSPIKLCESCKEMKPASEQVPEAYHALLNDVYFPSVTVPEMLILDNFGPDDVKSTVEILKAYGFTETDRLVEFLTLIEPFFTNPDNDSLSVLGLQKKMIAEEPKIKACAEPLAKAFIEFYDKNEQKINEDLNKLAYNDPKLDVLDTLQTILKDMKDQSNILKYDRGLESRTLTVFDHKVADDLSLPPHYQSGAIFGRDGEIKGYSEIFTALVVYKSVK